jgi:hypothetical protein
MCQHFGGTCSLSHPDSVSFTQKIKAAGPIKIVPPLYKDICNFGRDCCYACIFVIVTMRMIRMTVFGCTW